MHAGLDRLSLLQIVALEQDLSRHQLVLSVVVSLNLYGQAGNQRRHGHLLAAGLQCPCTCCTWVESVSKTTSLGWSEVCKITSVRCGP